MADKNDISNLEKVKELAGDILEYRSVDVQSAYTRVHQRTQKKSHTYTLKQVISRIAVILLLPLLISSLVFSYLYIEQKRQNLTVAHTQVCSAPGTVVQVELPDHSRVWLNAGSTLSYPSHFVKKEREVLLSGEGYFEVQSDTEHPFYVTTPSGIKVMAHGTRFNVNAYEDEPIIEAVLEKGKIDIIGLNKTIQLKPNEQVTFDKKTAGFVVSPINIEEKTAWKDGRLIFRNTPLDAVVKKLSRRYNVDIILHKNSNKEYKYRATFTTETVEQILDYLKLTAPIEWSIEDLKQNEDTSFAKGRIDVYLNK